MITLMSLKTIRIFRRMQVRWESKVRFELAKVLDYLLIEYGVNGARKFSEELNEWVQVIKENPLVAKQEPLLMDLMPIYRSVVVHKYQKLIFRIEDDTVFFVDLWDTRRDPNVLREQLR